AIVRTRVLQDIEGRLRKMGIQGMSVFKVKGFGEDKYVLAEHTFSTHAHVKIEIFVEKTKAYEIAAAILETAHTGGPGDGIICVLPVEKIFRIRTKTEARPDEV
ncbi:MAG TPA: P-II family nitrogen regulator, partial [Syntrophobacteria bacterium]|nr:P-II family nitrogen regulator [Syntrophobacteria bacterium]